MSARSRSERSASPEDSSQVLLDRRRKLEGLRAAGIEPFPHAFAGVRPIAEVLAPHAALEAGAETAATARVAGRLAARRGQGKAAFLDIVDRSGKLQLLARADVLGEQAFARLLALDLGDLIGADGTILRTRRGELSLAPTSVTLLAKTLRPPPDKHHGLADIELRYRRRELDLLSDPDARELFITRARVITAVREFLDAERFIEVETPVLQPIYGGAAARPFVTHHNQLDRDLYLRIATELYLKRLLVGGLERVYEIGKNFRNEGVSFKHNPEFTVLEWYEAYADYNDVAARSEALFAHVAAAVGYAGEIDFASPWRRETFAGAIGARSGVDILANRTHESLGAAVREQGHEVPEAEQTWGQLVDYLLTKFVEPDLVAPTFLLDYPVEISPLAKRHRDDSSLTERFEGFVAGMEVSNGFSELNDPDDQRARFEQQRELSDAGDDEAHPIDESYVRALEHGLPPNGGIGIGIDRLVMLMTGKRSIREVVLFPAMR